MRNFRPLSLLGEGVAVEGVGLLNNQTYNQLVSRTPNLFGIYQTHGLKQMQIKLREEPGLISVELLTGAGGEHLAHIDESDYVIMVVCFRQDLMRLMTRLNFAVQDTGGADGYDDSQDSVEVRAYISLLASTM